MTTHWKTEVAAKAAELLEALEAVPSSVAHYAVEQSRPLLRVLAELTPTDQEDMTARWRPSEEQVAAAVAKLEASGHPDWLAAVPLAMPGKVHGVWEVGQVVEPVPGVWVGANSFEVPAGESYADARNDAAMAGRKALAGRPGTCAWVTVHADGHWAVFEDF